MNIAVIGTGYVGLVTGVCFADVGNNVLCIDNDPEKLARLHSGEVHIFEPGLQIVFDRGVKEGRLKFSNSLEEAVRFAEVIFLALPTPPMEDGSADLHYVLNVSGEIADLMNKSGVDYRIIVNKSTVPVGTADKVSSLMKERTEIPFDVVSNPEFLREGVAVDDFMRPDRVVVGTSSERVRKTMDALYKPFLMSGNPIIYMDERSSELTKYASNSFLAAKITFMNEIANLCELVGADVDNVRKGMGADDRIGKRFLFAGVGYGGSCFPKDVKALNFTAQEYGYRFKILESVMSVNERQKEILVDKILQYFGSDLTGKVFALWGIAFKPNTDDIREAPSLVIINALLSKGARIKVYDPEAMTVFSKYYPTLSVEIAENQYTALEGAHALVIVTEWNEFRTPDFPRIKSLMEGQVIFDGRNVYELSTMEELGFHYESIGRAPVKAD